MEGLGLEDDTNIYQPSSGCSYHQPFDIFSRLERASAPQALHTVMRLLKHGDQATRGATDGDPVESAETQLAVKGVFLKKEVSEPSPELVDNL